MAHRFLWLCVASTFALTAPIGCGGRTGLVDDQFEGRARPVPRPEVCNGLDDDLDGLVALGVLDDDGGRRDAGPRVDAGSDAGMDAGSPDAGPRDGGPDADAGRMDAGPDVDQYVDEDFRDGLGRYIVDEHCGVCGARCTASREHELEAHCGLVDEFPTCVATRCEPGFIPSTAGRCVPLYERLCLFCADDGDCGDFDGARCARIGDEQRCTIDCDLSCPAGYTCSGSVCAPASGSCSCEPGDDFDLACALDGPDDLVCPGSASCRDGVLSMCVAPPEECDREDDDCNGVIDDPFVNTVGGYDRDIHHCGDCGIDCTLSSVPEGDLVCGGDPFAPTCVLFCPDTADGIDVGDRVDADRIIATGCECTVGSLTDDPGPVRTSGEMLDVNCDGADGIVLRSFYVAPDGNDAGPGSPTRPLRTLTVAMQRASESLASGAPRPHVFIASGTYAESIELPDGVLVHGGYRRDFLSLDPDGFRVDIRAPASTTAPGGAAVIARGAGTQPTTLEWVFVRGRDATEEGAATFGIYALDPGPALTLRDLTVRSGAAGAGRSGNRGAEGRSFESLPELGEVPRGAVESAAHSCLGGDARNTVRGGVGGRNTCGGSDVSGGAGGSSACPMMSAFQAAGSPGRSAAVPGGAGGPGGQDSRGPITSDTGTCPVAVCCGLADFSVPTDFVGPQPGAAGRDGANGTAGTACTEPFGRFEGDRWLGVDASSGTNGTAGSGGGGGGAGGGAEMDWFDRVCEFVDGLGGGGGGGGAGGCGGEPGRGATSGAPAVAILVRYTTTPAAGPTITGVRIASGEGGRGGDGGAGGEGGRGVSGAFGGELAREARSTPTLSGPFAGGRGGPGGDGGAGGGGGGGCGGASVGIWITGLTREPTFVAAWRSANTFTIGVPGPAGRGGGGPSAGPDGAEGGASDVLVR